MKLPKWFESYGGLVIIASLILGVAGVSIVSRIMSGEVSPPPPTSRLQWEAYYSGHKEALRGCLDDANGDTLEVDICHTVHDSVEPQFAQWRRDLIAAGKWDKWE